MTDWDRKGDTLWGFFVWGADVWDDGPNPTTYSKTSDTDTTFTAETASTTTWSSQ